MSSNQFFFYFFDIAKKNQQIIDQFHYIILNQILVDNNVFKLYWYSRRIWYKKYMYLKIFINLFWTDNFNISNNKSLTVVWISLEMIVGFLVVIKRKTLVAIHSKISFIKFMMFVDSTWNFPGNLNMKLCQYLMYNDI